MKKPARLRERVRAITDKLRPGKAFLLRDIHGRLKGKRPSMPTLAMCIRDMVRKGELERDDAPPGSGTGARYAYRSGSEPVRFHYDRNGKGQKIRTGFQALARLEKEDPKEWARITDGGRI